MSDHSDPTSTEDVSNALKELGLAPAFAEAVANSKTCTYTDEYNNKTGISNIGSIASEHQSEAMVEAFTNPDFTNALPKCKP